MWGKQIVKERVIEEGPDNDLGGHSKNFVCDVMSLDSFEQRNDIL